MCIDELHYLFSSSYYLKKIRGIKLLGYVARIGDQKCQYDVRCNISIGKPGGKRQFEGLRYRWVDPDWYRDKWYTLMQAAMKFQVPLSADNLDDSATISTS